MKASSMSISENEENIESVTAANEMKISKRK